MIVMNMDPKLFIFTGLMLIIVGMITIMLSIRARGLGSTTGFVLLGPIPIVWHGSRTPLLILILIPIAIIAIILLNMVMLR